MEFRVNSLYTFVMFLFTPQLLFGYSVYYGTPDRKLQTGYVLATRTALSSIHCAVQCGMKQGCSSVSFKPATNECLLATGLLAAEIQLYTDAELGWETFSKNDWLLTFRAPKGIEGDPYLSFANGVGVTTNTTDCANLSTTTCQTNYRHPILDNWGIANITQVRFSFYKNQAEAAYVVFDASGSSLTSWFTKDRILDSTWPTSGTDNYVFFEIDGAGTIDGHSLESRRFAMFLNFGGCPVDRMYSVAIVSSNNPYLCGFDTQSSSPQFIYASTTAAGTPESGTGTDKADFLVIFVKS